MNFFVGVLLLAAVLGVLVLAVRNALRLLVLTVHEGHVVTARGRAPGELLREIEDVLERTRATGKLIVQFEGGVAAVRTEGLDDATTQRLRNVVGRFPKARLENAPRIAPPRRPGQRP